MVEMKKTQIKDPEPDYLEDEHYLERCVLDSAIDETLQILEEEILNKDNDLVEYHCPYCDFKSDYFNIVVIHIACTINCSKKQESQPCYPVMSYKSDNTWNLFHKEEDPT